MATPLDLQEQEQLDALNAFWKQYGNLITWVLIAALAAYAGLNGWRWWQRDHAFKAGAIFEQLEIAAQAKDANRVGAIFGDLKARYPGTTYAEQGALIAAQTQYEAGQSDAALATLTWLADKAGEDEYRTVARLRLAGLLLQAKKPEEALRQLDAAKAPTFAPLVADRRGDVLMAMGKTDEAKSAYLTAWKTIDPKLQYRELIDAKLTALGAAPQSGAGAEEAMK